jgi:hypothetical protein
LFLFLVLFMLFCCCFCCKDYHRCQNFDFVHKVCTLEQWRQVTKQLSKCYHTALHKLTVKCTAVMHCRLHYRHLVLR